jgi:hypothetical protein
MDDEVRSHDSHDAEQRFAWQSMDAYIAGELTPEAHARVEAFLGASPRTKDFVAAHKQFAEAVKRSMQETPVECPQGLHDKVLAALDRCEIDADEELAVPARFPWFGATLLAAASVMIAVGLVLYFNDTPEQTPDMPASLVPVVSNATLDVPRSERCRYRKAVEEYRKFFPEGPELPNRFGETRCRVSDYHCDDVDGRPVMCAVFDTSDGDRVAMMIFKGECLGRSAPDALRSAEVEIEGKRVWWWRAGRYVCALVAKSGDDGLRRRIEQMKAAVER